MPHRKIRAFIDFFYAPFRQFLPIHTFRYAACGGFNMLLDIFLYFISYNFILKKQIVHTAWVDISPYVAAFIMAFAVSFPVGFLLSKYVVWTESMLKGRIQLFRYFIIVLMCILLNYIFIKLFVEQFHFYPTVAKTFTTVIVVAFSYVSQKHYSFKHR